MDTTDQPRVALLGHGYWGPNLARNLHMRLGRALVASKAAAVMAAGSIGAIVHLSQTRCPVP
jgi:hypothetical protein